MHNSEWEDPESTRSRPGSRRNSGPFSRRSSIKKEPEKSTPPTSSSSTPKKVYKQLNPDFVVTGKQLLKRGDRANSLPGYHRRQSSDSLLKSKRGTDSPKRSNTAKCSSREASIEDDASLDLSQVSDFEDLSLKYGLKDKITPLATSTPKKICQKGRSSSVQVSGYQREGKKDVRLLESKKSRDSIMSSRDSVYKTSSSGTYSAHSTRRAVSTELDYSSMSPEYSAASSGDSVAGVADTLVSPRSQDLQDSFSVGTWAECGRGEGEWGHFWANYNSSLAKVPVGRYYDQCPTPYRSEDIELADLEFSTDGSRKRSPENIKTINNIIRNEGLRLTPRETQNVIKCAHILGNVLTKAIERQTKDRDFSSDKIQELKIEKPNPETEIKKKNLSLDLKETVIPLEVKEEKRWESVPTQTDISLPNTKSAPKIFESILRQLSMTSIEEDKVNTQNGELKVDTPNNSQNNNIDNKLL
ncbi:uncharacterized protein LOC112047812 [Bicyclus anynana]|uniref:Uncharacterized protein LOC112047812 n=1 Tax=Bicyclus anynana TaxID=110368 RepID=A0A6J1N1T7_BICAN|nr:uncharacterized protein LOC112047812 [Bicyclus anynana]